VLIFTLHINHQENITTFIKCCQMLGLQATELFETPDLYNAADMMRVHFSRFTVSPALAPELTRHGGGIRRIGSSVPRSFDASARKI
jgi:hypothetical protein